jgi:hypothetical protein
MQWSKILFVSSLELIDVLVQSGRLDRGFFELLVRERPRHQHEIAKVAVRYGIELAVPSIDAPRTVPPRVWNTRRRSWQHDGNLFGGETRRGPLRVPLR